MLFTPPFLLRIECPLILIVFKFAQNPVLLCLACLSLREKLRFRRDLYDLLGADGSVELVIIHEVRVLISASVRQYRVIAAIHLRFQVHALD